MYIFRPTPRNETKSVKLDRSDGAGDTYRVFVGSGPERIEVRQGSCYAKRGSLLPQLKQGCVN